MITKLIIKNFKLFDDAEIELGNPVVFIGPNNSGKTSALQVLALWDIGLKRWLEKRKGIEVEARDIFFIKDRLKVTPLERLHPLRPFLLIGDGIATLLVLIIFLYLKRQEELETNVALKRRIHAPRAVRRGLRQMGKLMKDPSREAQQKFCEIAQKTLNGYVSAQMNVSAHSLTVPMVEDALEERGESHQTIERLKIFYDLCNQVRFTGTEIDHGKKEELLNTVEIVSKSMARKKK